MAPFRGSAPGNASASRRAGAVASAGSVTSPAGSSKQHLAPARERHVPSDGDGASPHGASASKRNMLPLAVQAAEVPETALPNAMALTAAALAMPDPLEPRGLPD